MENAVAAALCSRGFCYCEQMADANRQAFQVHRRRTAMDSATGDGQKRSPRQLQGVEIQGFFLGSLLRLHGQQGFALCELFIDA